MVGEGLGEGIDRAERRHAALHVGVVNHNVAEHLGGVEPFIPAVAPIVLVGGEAAVHILQGEDDVHGVEDALFADDGALVLDAGHVPHAQHGLEALRRAVGDRPAVGAGAEGPAALAHVAVVAFAHRRRFVRVGWARLGRRGIWALRDAPMSSSARPGAHLALWGTENLRPLEVGVGLARHVRKLVGKVGLGKGLQRKARVPTLRAVVALHLHAVLGDPQVVRHPQQVLLEGRGRYAAPGVHKPREGVQNLVHGSNVHVVGLLVLGADVLDDKGEARASDKVLEGPRPVLVDGEHGVGHLHDRVHGRVVVHVGDKVPGGRPVDAPVVLAVELFSKGQDDGVRLGVRIDEPLAVEIAHRKVDHAAVAPEPTRVEGEPLWQEPELRGDGVVPFPVHDTEEAHVELGPAPRVDAPPVGLRSSRQGQQGVGRTRQRGRVGGRGVPE